MAVSIESELFYKVISEETGLDITEEYELPNCIKTLSKKQKEFDKIAQAYEQVQETGYGIVMPTIDELTLDEPQIIKQSGKYGIKLRASAPSIHMMKIFTQTEVTPIVGSEQQSEELVSYLLENLTKIRKKSGRVTYSENQFTNSLTRDFTTSCTECLPMPEGG